MPSLWELVRGEGKLVPILSPGASQVTRWDRRWALPLSTLLPGACRTPRGEKCLLGPDEESGVAAGTELSLGALRAGSRWQRARSREEAECDRASATPPGTRVPSSKGRPLSKTLSVGSSSVFPVRFPKELGWDWRTSPLNVCFNSPGRPSGPQVFPVGKFLTTNSVSF